MGRGQRLAGLASLSAALTPRSILEARPCPSVPGSGGPFLAGKGFLPSPRLVPFAFRGILEWALVSCVEDGHLVTSRLCLAVPSSGKTHTKPGRWWVAGWEHADAAGG